MLDSPFYLQGQLRPPPFAGKQGMEAVEFSKDSFNATTNLKSKRLALIRVPKNFDIKEFEGVKFGSSLCDGAFVMSRQGKVDDAPAALLKSSLKCKSIDEYWVVKKDVGKHTSLPTQPIDFTKDIGGVVQPKQQPKGIRSNLSPFNTDTIIHPRKTKRIKSSSQGQKEKNG